MTREEAVEVLKERYLTCVGIGLDNHANRVNEALNMAIEALRHDVIFEQIKWERDVALQTLEEHGIGLGQKAEYIIPNGDVMFTSEVVRCKDCRYKELDGEVTHYYWCRLHDRPVDDTDYCAWGDESEVE